MEGQAILPPPPGLHRCSSRLVPWGPGGEPSCCGRGADAERCVLWLQLPPAGGMLSESPWGVGWTLGFPSFPVPDCSGVVLCSCEPVVPSHPSSGRTAVEAAVGGGRGLSLSQVPSIPDAARDRLGDGTLPHSSYNCRCSRPISPAPTPVTPQSSGFFSKLASVFRAWPFSGPRTGSGEVPAGCRAVW